jgi:hypothetical protein
MRGEETELKQNKRRGFYLIVDLADERGPGNHYEEEGGTGQPQCYHQHKPAR